MANKKKNTERTEEQKEFNKKMWDFQSRANRLAEELAHFLICSPLWPTVPEKHPLYPKRRLVADLLNEQVPLRRIAQICKVDRNTLSRYVKSTPFLDFRAELQQKN